MKVTERTFISYSSKDHALVDKLVKYLEDNGVLCWYAPRNIVPGKHYASSILEAIRSANAFVIVFSSQSNSSDQCLKEVDRAVNAKKPIIPFRIDETMPAEAMDYYLCNTHWLNAFEGNSESYFEQLVHAIHDFISIDNEQTEYLTEVKKKLGPSDELQDIISSLKEEAIRDEDAVAKYKVIKNENEEKKDKKRNATIVKFPSETQKVKKLVIKESVPLVMEAKKKRKSNQKIFEKPETKTSRIRKKIQYPAALIGFSLSLYLISTMLSKNNITNVEVEKRISLTKKRSYKKGKRDKEDSVDIEEVNIRTNLLDMKELGKLSTNELKKMKDSILHRDGSLFERQGRELVEVSWKKIEIQNYFLLKYLISEKSKPSVRGLIPNVYLNILTETNDEIMQTKMVWELSHRLVKENIFSNSINLSTFRVYPEGVLVSLPKSGELIVSLEIIESKEKKITILYNKELQVKKVFKRIDEYARELGMSLEVKKASSEYNSKEIHIKFQAPYQSLELYEGHAIKLMNIVRYLISSNPLLLSI